jgi:hypothetical protein
MSPTQQVARRYFDAWTSGDQRMIASSNFVTDMAAFAAFAGAGGRG